jgi:serine/threonine protein kinase
MTIPSPPFEWNLSDMIPDLKEFDPPHQATLSKYRFNGQVYVIKFYDHESLTQREIRFLQAAADISVEVKGYVRNQKHAIIGFTMSFLDEIKPSRLRLDEKVNIFRQIREFIPHLHDRHKIIHGDIKLSNMLLDHGVVKLCDYGCAAWMSETKYPTAFSMRWCCPYRLGSNPDINPRPLIPQEDIYASAITVWELFVAEIPYGPFVSQDDEFELWDRIVEGLTIDVARIEHEDARRYVDESLSIKECANKD